MTQPNTPKKPVHFRIIDAKQRHDEGFSFVKGQPVPFSVALKESGLEQIIETPEQMLKAKKYFEHALDRTQGMRLRGDLESAFPDARTNFMNDRIFNGAINKFTDFIIANQGRASAGNRSL